MRKPGPGSRGGRKTKRPVTGSSFQIPREGVIEETGRRGSSTGSAFSVSSEGYWLTARHVVEGCDQAYIQTGTREGARVVRTAIHPQADVALLITDGAPEGLPVAASRMGKRESFSVGFPKGRPGAVHGRFLGEMTMRHMGRLGVPGRVYAWSIVSEIAAEIRVSRRLERGCSHRRRRAYRRHRSGRNRGAEVAS